MGVKARRLLITIFSLKVINGASNIELRSKRDGNLKMNTRWELYTQYTYEDGMVRIRNVLQKS